MHRLAVLGSLLLAWSWIVGLPVYASPLPRLALSLAAVGSVLVLLAPVPADEAPPGRRVRRALGPSIALALLPWPYAVPFAAFALAAFAPPPTAARLRHLGAVGAIQAGVVALLWLPGWIRTAELEPLWQPVALLLRAFGVDASVADDGLWLHGARTTGLSLTMDSTGLTVAALMIAARLLLDRGRPLPLLSFTAVLFAYTLLRLVALVILGRALGDEALLCHPLVLLASFVPFALLAAALAPPLAPAGGAWAAAGAPRAQRRWLPLAGAVAGALLTLPFAASDADRGTRRGRILVDDAHGPWEQGRQLADLSDFGTDSVYNYSALWDWVGRHYPTRIHSDGELTAEGLADVDILVLKMPSFAYAERERAVVDRFVRDGGSLWAIGDHTDVFGSSAALNGILVPFGLRIESDVACLVRRQFVGNYRYRPSTLVANPLVRHVEAGLDLMGPASITVTSGHADHFLAAAAHALDAADYRDGSFFGDTRPTFDDRIAPLLFCVAKRIDAGRVVVWSDSTIFSNFCLFEPGKSELVRSLLEYLNRDGGADSASLLAHRLWPFVLLAIALLLARQSVAGTASLLVGLALGCGLVGAWSHWRLDRLPARAPIAPFTTIGFDARLGHCGVDFPTASDRSFEQRDRSPEYSTMFVGVLRQRDRFPFVVAEERALARADVLFVVDPRGALDEAWVDAIRRRVESGMQLVVTESLHGDLRTTNELLGRFGMSVRGHWQRDVPNSLADVAPRSFLGTGAGPLSIADATLNLAGWWRSPAPGHPLAIAGATVLGIAGGMPIWTGGAAATPILAAVSIGRGRVFACTAGAAFRNEAMGFASDDLMPEDPQIESYVRLGALLDVVLAPPGAPPPLPVPPAIRWPVPADASPAAVPGPAAAEVFDALRRARAELAGSLRAVVTCIARDGSRAAFTAGLVATDAERSVVRVLESRGESTVTRVDTEEFRFEPGGFLWAGRGNPLVLSVPHAEGVDPGGVLTLPAAWLSRPWQVARGSLAEALSATARMQLADLTALGRDFRSRCERAGYLQSEWTEAPGQDDCFLLRSDHDLPIAAGWLGQIRLVVQATPPRLRQVVLAMRPRGQPRDGSWLHVRIDCDDFETHPEPLRLLEIPRQRIVVAQGLRLARLRGD